MSLPTLDIAAKIRATKFTTVSELAVAIADALVGLAKQQTFNRGLYDDSVVGEEGGTKASASDQSIARKSISLQPPQLLKTRKHGAIAARQQSRLDIETRTVPAVVVSVDGDGPGAEVTVVLAGDVPRTGVDPVTGQNVPADQFSHLSDDAATGTTFTLTVSGKPFADPGDDEDTGPLVPEVGQTILVAVSTQGVKRTIWHTRNGVNAPRVVSVDAGQSAAIVNNLCCQHDDGGGGGGS